MNTNEAHAVITLKNLLNAKTQLARVMVSQRSPAVIDWLLERGFVVNRMPNANKRAVFTQDVPCAYVTPAGRAWFHSTDGAGVAMLVLARELRDLTAANPRSDAAGAALASFVNVAA